LEIGKQRIQLANLKLIGHQYLEKKKYLHYKENIFLIRYFYIVLLTYNILWNINSFWELWQPPGHKFQQLSIFCLSPTPKGIVGAKRAPMQLFLG
jgi:hypothetical protein